MVAAEYDLPYACIPSGTRNHFALDLGVDRNDVVGALDAFVSGGERRVDLAEVNGRVFVNNVSLGLYADAVQRPEYRDAKLRTLLDTVPEALGPNSKRPSLFWERDDRQQSAVAVLVSNNPYRLGRQSVRAPAAPRPRAARRGGACANAPVEHRSKSPPPGNAAVDGNDIRAPRRSARARRHRRRGHPAGSATRVSNSPRGSAGENRSEPPGRVAVGAAPRQAVGAYTRARPRRPPWRSPRTADRAMISRIVRAEPALTCWWAIRTSSATMAKPIARLRLTVTKVAVGPRRSRRAYRIA